MGGRDLGKRNRSSSQRHRCPLAGALPTGPTDHMARCAGGCDELRLDHEPVRSLHQWTCVSAHTGRLLIGGIAMAKKMHDTPMLDQLESGPWPSFVTGLKRLAKDKDYMVDLVGQLEHSYETRKGYWKG